MYLIKKFRGVIFLVISLLLIYIRLLASISYLELLALLIAAIMFFNHISVLKNVSFRTNRERFKKHKIPILIQSLTMGLSLLFLFLTAFSVHKNLGLVASICLLLSISSILENVTLIIRDVS